MSNLEEQVVELKKYIDKINLFLEELQQGLCDECRSTS